MMNKTVICIAAAMSVLCACDKNNEPLTPDHEVPEDGTIINRLIPENDNDCFVIPRRQTCSGGVYPDSSSPQWGSAAYPEPVVMHGLCATLDFTLSTDGQNQVTGITLTAHGGEFLSGTFGMGYYNGAFNGEWAAKGDNSNGIEIVFDPALQLSAGGTIIHIPVLAQSFAKGFSARIYSASSQWSEISFFSDGRILSPGETYDLPRFTFNPDDSTVNLDDYDENILFDSGLLTAGTYNILNASGRSDCPDNPWGDARAHIASIIKDMDCDIMTINELSLSEFYWLRANISGYEWILRPNNNGYYSYAPGIIYKASRLEKISDGIFWLSDPETSSLITGTSAYSYTDPSDGKVYSAGSNRACLWAIFKDLHTGRKFCWFAPHPHIRSDDAASSLASTVSCLNAGNIRSLLRQIPYVNAENLPYVIAGDLNTNSSHVSYREVLKKAPLENAFEAAIDANVMDAKTATKPGTCPGKNSGAYNHGESTRIDHIWYNGFNVKSYRQIYTMYDKGGNSMIYPSDHIPIRAVLSFR